MVTLGFSTAEAQAAVEATQRVISTKLQKQPKLKANCPRTWSLLFLILQNQKWIGRTCLRVSYGPITSPTLHGLDQTEDLLHLVCTPSLHNPCLEEIAIAVDTSGSISDDELTQFTTETSYILHELNPERVQFIQCDSEINQTTEYTRESLPLKVTYKAEVVLVSTQLLTTLTSIILVLLLLCI